MTLVRRAWIVGWQGQAALWLRWVRAKRAAAVLLLTVVIVVLGWQGYQPWRLIWAWPPIWPSPPTEAVDLPMNQRHARNRFERGALYREVCSGGE